MKRPISVLVVVLSDDGQTLLLCRRSPADFWQSVTGSLRQGESPVEAARRELHEETGITDSSRLVDTQVSCEFEILPAWRHKFPAGTTHNLEHRFVLHVSRADPVSISLPEHRGYAWVTLPEALRRVSYWTNREALQQALPD